MLKPNLAGAVRERHLEGVIGRGQHRLVDPDGAGSVRRRMRAMLRRARRNIEAGHEVG